MALAYLCCKDDVDGGFKMFSLADPSGYRTAWVALRNCLYLLPLGYLAYDWAVLLQGGSVWNRHSSVLQSVQLQEDLRPPVAYASVAPFPFLPAPYVSN
ncbi:heme o synthase [Salvia divinorum]|uniref:Heme o synthase n=1 Tax=Salvia divinorum TaxID=28513 RepID=A0ABD1FYB8_SALDI